MRNIVLFLALLIFGSASAQLSEAETKQVNKSLTLFNKGKHDKGITMLVKVQQNHTFNDDLWGYRVQMEYQRYLTQLNKDLATAQKKYSSERDQNAFLNSAKSTQYESSMLAACSMATLYCEKQEMACIVLRIFLVDDSREHPDRDAKEEYSKGEEKFEAGDFTAAIRYYKKAIDIDSNYYKATLYLGDAYYANEDYESSVKWFKKACNMRPGLLEPRKYLTDAYMKMKKWNDAFDACVEGISVYPDAGMFIKLEDICDKQGKQFKRHWVARKNYPNSLAIDQQPIVEEPWSFYRAAKSDIKFYCNQDGVITEQTEKTTSKYMEIYSWESMLKKDDNAPEFAFAHDMQDAGYLDCYAFISMYHISFQAQFEKWSKDNRARIKEYVTKYLVK